MHIMCATQAVCVYYTGSSMHHMGIVARMMCVHMCSMHDVHAYV